MDYELKLLFEVLLEKSRKLRLEADESLQDLYETLEKVDIDLDVDMESNKEVQLKTAIRDYIEKRNLWL